MRLAGDLLRGNDAVTGALTLACVRDERDWRDEIVPRLQLFGKLLVVVVLLLLRVCRGGRHGLHLLGVCCDVFGIAKHHFVRHLAFVANHKTNGFTGFHLNGFWREPHAV